MGDDEAASHARTARSRMRLLETEFLTPPAGRPDGQPTARSVTARAPIDLRILDHMQAAIEEIITNTRAAAPLTSPAPHDSGVYEWAIAQVEAAPRLGLEPARRRYLDIVIYRQGLEHALAAGDHDEVSRTVRRQTCPACGCMGLFWRPAARTGVCVNRHCRTPTGRPATWDLQHIAAQHIRTAAEKSSCRSAT